MVTEMAGYEGFLARQVTHFTGRRWLFGYEPPHFRGDAGRRVARDHRLEIVLPDGVTPAVAGGRPIARVGPEINHGNPVLRDSLRDVRDHLLDKREQADVPLADNMELPRPVAHRVPPGLAWWLVRDRLVTESLRPG